MQKDWHSFSVKKTFAELKTTEKGLSREEAEKRLLHYGPNLINKEKKFSYFYLFLSQLKGSLTLVLLGAALATFLLKEILDMYVILGAVAINVFFGFFQEAKAERVIANLKKTVKHNVRVLRDGQIREIDSEGIVPGDIIIVQEGMKIPADARLVEIQHLKTNEALLTGESLPVRKTIRSLEKGLSILERKNIIFMGTIIAQGKGKAIVVETGSATQLGRIARQIKETKETETPLQLKLNRFSRVLSLILIGIVIFIFLEGVWKGKAIAEMFTTSVALAVAAIPEGLIISITIILAIGMTRLFKEKALLRKLVAGEALGSTTIIAADKTGTITRGKMTVTEVVTPKSPKRVRIDSKKHRGTGDTLFALKIALTCNNALVENPEDNLKEWRLLGTPTEKAMLEAGIEAGLKEDYLRRDEERLDEITFSSEKKYMAVLYPWDRKKNIIFYDGAPERILEKCTFLRKNNKEEKLYLKEFQDLKETLEKLTEEGLRVIGVAYRFIPKKVISFRQIKDHFSDLVFVGFFGLNDPIRRNVQKSLNSCRKAGIKVIMLTGDHKLTAKAIAEKLGLRAKSENILEGKTLEKLDDAELDKLSSKISVYARITPHDKFRIIESLQKKGEVVAMTGDGINDAPALKKADIGLAVGSGTDVAKEASDIIILDDNFRTIVKAVKEGRIIFDNIKKVIVYLLFDSFTEVILVGGSLLLGLPLPVLAAQILWVNLIEDGLPDFALAFEPAEEGIMEEPPRPPESPLLDSEMKTIIFVAGIVADLALLGLFFFFCKRNYGLDYIQTMIFALLGINSLLCVFPIKNLKKSLTHINIFSNKYLLGAVGFGFLALFSGIYFPPFQVILKTVPLKLTDWLIVFGIGILNVLMIEAVKPFFFKRKN